MTDYLPVYLDVSKRKILIVGAGNVARQKLRVLNDFRCDITVMAPDVGDDIKASAAAVEEKEYFAGALAGFDLVYACTDNAETNRRIYDDARKAGVLVNVVDNPALSDFISPAVHVDGPMVIAVSSGGKDVKRTIRLRDKIRDFLKNDIS